MTVSTSLNITISEATLAVTIAIKTLLYRVTHRSLSVRLSTQSSQELPYNFYTSCSTDTAAGFSSCSILYGYDISPVANSPTANHIAVSGRAAPAYICISNSDAISDDHALTKWPCRPCAQARYTYIPFKHSFFWMNLGYLVVLLARPQLV